MKKNYWPEVQLFALSFLTLFLELLLLRYLKSSVWCLAYFPKLILIGVFSGMGLGFLFHSKISNSNSRFVFTTSFIVILLLVATTQLFPVPLPHMMGGDIGAELYLAGSSLTTELLIYAKIFPLFLGSLLCVAGISQLTARYFTKFSALRAYSIDIAGSCAGIVSFSLLSFAGAQPEVWFALTAVIVLFCWSKEFGFVDRAVTLLAILATVGLVNLQERLFLGSYSSETMVASDWSPYQKLQLTTLPDSHQQLFVNSIAHQLLANPGDFEHSSMFSFYSRPYHVRKDNTPPLPIKRVMVVGAGTGNDVAAALAEGAEYVLAIEIDPKIAEYGKRYHPLKPYADPRVKLVIGDARAVIAQSQESFDLIILGLTNSFVKASPLAQIRLENYLFTLEAFGSMRRLLNDQGELVVFNYFHNPWLQRRVRDLLSASIGSSPQILYESSGYVQISARKISSFSPGITLDKYQNLPTDDWPFLYIERPSIPITYKVVALSIIFVVLIFMAAGSMLNPPASTSPKSEAEISLRVAFFLMGAAFFLLETKGITQFSLIFGATWLNNSLVFLAVLLMVLLANWCALPLRATASPFIFALLFLSCIWSSAFELTALTEVVSPLWRFVCASLVVFSPIFFANLAFSLYFRHQQTPENIFGWNLMGTTAGCLLELTSTLAGYNTLALLALALYVGVFLALKRAESLLMKRAKHVVVPRGGQHQPTYEAYETLSVGSLPSGAVQLSDRPIEKNIA